MMDVVDMVTEQNDKILDSQIRKASEKRTLSYSGYCYYCSEHVKSPFRFCNADCARDYEEELAIRQKQGLQK